MNIHEYQAKALLRDYGAPVADGRAVLRGEEAKTAASALDGPLWVVKAQIHAGGRGKGSFKEASAGEKGTRPKGLWAVGIRPPQGHVAVRARCHKGTWP